MSDDEFKDLVLYKLKRAKETIAEVEIHIQNEFWSTAVNRIYYSCYYAVTAVLISKGIEPTTHAGVRQMFGLHFIKSGLLDSSVGRFFSDIFDIRQTGDYDDFIDFDKEQVIELSNQAKNLIFQIELFLSNQ